MNDVVADADVDDANDDVSWLRSLLESRRPKPGPVVGRWALGIGDLVANHPVTPRILRGLTRKLNHFGGVAISEESVEFDGDDVKWSDITEIRIPAEVRYHGLLRTRELSPGLLAALILADPAVRQCFEATAQAHDTTICPAGDDVMEDADERAEQIKSLLDKLKR